MDPARCDLTLAQLEREHILDLLTCCRGDRMQVAKILDISIRSLRLKLHDYAQSGYSVCKPSSGAKDSSFRCDFAKSHIVPCRPPPIDKTSSTERSTARTDFPNNPTGLRLEAEFFQRLSHAVHIVKTCEDLEKLSMKLMDEAAALEKDLVN